MGMKITGPDALQRTLEDAGQAFATLDGEVATLTFNPGDPASVEAAIADMEAAIDAKLAPYHGNAIVETMAAKLKVAYRDQILERAAAPRSQVGEKTVGQEIADRTVFRQIENTVADLRQSQSNTFERHVKKLSKILHDGELAPISSKLSEGIDLDELVNSSQAAHRGMGNPTLKWPDTMEGELGATILLIDRFAEDPSYALGFSHTFYGNGVNNLTSNLQGMIREIVVPFARDYINYVKESTGSAEPTLLPERREPAARKAFVVHGHDNGAREAVARFLRGLASKRSFSMSRRAKGARSSRRSRQGDIGFAVVLLTPDDVGGVKDGECRPRARQNVLFELGYFIGRLGRSRVCALKRGEVEIPSDFGGVIYEPLDSGSGWKVALGRELKAAGFKLTESRLSHERAGIHRRFASAASAGCRRRRPGATPLPRVLCRRDPQSAHAPGLCPRGRRVPCVVRGVPSLAAVQPLHVATWIGAQARQVAAPSVKQRLAAIRHLFDWLVTGQAMPINPAASVWGPVHIVRHGRTPVLDPGRGR